MDSVTVKQMARELGADLVGIAPIERLKGLPARANPLTIMPQAKAVIVVGHRILRGALRGVEEGTNFHSTYSMYGFHWSENQFLSKTVYNLACSLEENGIEAVPLLGHKQNAADSVVLDYQVIAKAAGLGDIGKGGFFLTPEYGHRQRLAMIIVDVALEGDEVQHLDFCADCRACAEACPLHAMHDDGSGKFAIDTAVCSVCKNGMFAGNTDSVDRYAAACGRACLVCLENKIGNRFEQKFRKRSVWTIGAVDPKDPKNAMAFFGGPANHK